MVSLKKKQHKNKKKSPRETFNFFLFTYVIKKIINNILVFNNNKDI